MINVQQNILHQISSLRMDEAIRKGQSLRESSLSEVDKKPQKRLTVMKSEEDGP